MSKMNLEAKKTLRSAASLIEASKIKAKSEILETVAPEVQKLIEEEIEREINKNLSEKFNDIEDLENPIPEDDEEITDEEFIDDEESYDDELGAPPETSTEIESGEVEEISVEIDGSEYRGSYSAGDETIELELVDDIGGDPQSEDFIEGDMETAGDEDIDLDIDMEDDSELDIDLEDDEDEDFIPRKKSIGENVNKEKEFDVNERALKRFVRDAILSEIKNRKIQRATKNLKPRTRNLRKITVEDKLKNKGIIPNRSLNTTVNKNKLFENDAQRKEVFDQIIRLL